MKIKAATSRKLRQWNQDLDRGARLDKIRHERRMREIGKGDPNGIVRRHLLKTGAGFAAVIGCILAVIAWALTN